jgi:hypothetical protein
MCSGMAGDTDVLAREKVDKMMMPITGRAADSEAVFGSAARGDCDALSDRDYLIVDDDAAVLNRRSSELCAQGWSVASYTFGKLKFLSANGALFIQHIKSESQVLADREGRLSELLRRYSPKSKYTAELNSNARLAALIESRPDTPLGTLWAADVLYVALRNFGVLLSAERGNYVFAYAAVVDALIQAGDLPAQARSPLLKLRFLKTLYRSGENFSSRQNEESLALAIEYLPRLWFPPASKPVPPEAILLSAKQAPRGASAYERLRGLEKCLIAAGGLFPTFRHTEEAATLLSWIENPRAYAQLASRMEKEQLASLKQLLRRYQLRRITA